MKKLTTDDERKAHIEEMRERWEKKHPGMPRPGFLKKDMAERLKEALAAEEDEA